MPVFLRGIRVSFDIADQLGIGLRRRVKTERAVNVVILQIAVDRLRAADDLHAGVVRCEILRQHRRVRVGIVAADNYHSGQAVLLRRSCRRFELFFCLDLRSAGADDVKAAGITVRVNELVRKFHIVVIHKTARAALEAEKNIVLVCRLQRVIQAADDIVAAGRLPAGENNADNLSLRRGSVLPLLEDDFPLAVSIREQFSDLVLIRYAGGLFAFLYADIGNAVTQHSG